MITHKKELYLTAARIMILTAIVDCLEMTTEGMRIRKVHSVLKKHFEGKPEKISACLVQTVVDLLVEEKILKLIDRSRLAGDKVYSVLYEFNCDAFDCREIVEIKRDNTKGRKTGKTVEIKRPECPAAGEAEAAGPAGLAIPSAQPGDDPVGYAIQKIVKKITATEEHIRTAIESMKRAEQELSEAQIEREKYADLLRNYHSAQEQLLQAAEMEG